MFASNTSQVSSDATYIEDVFSTWLYTGAGANQTITNSIDLSGQGGLVWIKDRTQALAHRLYDTARGVGGGSLETNGTAAQNTFTGVTAFNSNGFSLSGANAYVTSSGDAFASWTFRKAPKFFDVVTYTGNGSNRTIAHSLGQAPGMIVVKSTSDATSWIVYHRGTNGGTNPEQYYTALNSTSAQNSSSTAWNNTAPTATNFTVGTAGFVNTNGATYVAYLFAHNAGGFGLTGTDNVISCGSFTTDGSGNADINLGYEAQYVMLKGSQYASNWYVEDNMRGLNLTQSAILLPNSSSAEINGTATVRATATGFATINGQLAGSATYIYIAIRRGPMKTPTSGASVFAPVSQAGGGTVTTGFPVDLSLNTKPSSAFDRYIVDRLRGVSLTTFNYLTTNTTAAETAGSGFGFGFDNNTGYKDNGVYGGIETPVYWNLRRAPGFFDEVCYTGAGNGTVINHNLGVEPELAIFKIRTGLSADWVVRAPGTGTDRYLLLNTTGAQATASGWYSATSSQITFPTSYAGTAQSGYPYVAYLFASCPGVSKVGSYTGNGSSQTINCGFTGGARFVLIKRTDSTGDWYVWDTARGIVSANDPRLSLNTTSAEVTTDDSIDPDNSGFIVNQVTATNINVSSATYIYLAIA